MISLAPRNQFSSPPILSFACSRTLIHYTYRCSAAFDVLRVTSETQFSLFILDIFRRSFHRIRTRVFHFLQRRMNCVSITFTKLSVKFNCIPLLVTIQILRLRDVQTRFYFFSKPVAGELEDLTTHTIGWRFHWNVRCLLYCGKHALSKNWNNASAIFYFNACIFPFFLFLLQPKMHN